MTDNSKLISVKIIHTLIWIFFNTVIFYMAYAVIFDKINFMVWLCVGIILIEGIVLMLFEKKCPLTVIAGKYSDSSKHNFDIYLPEWLAKYNKLIYTTAFIIILLGIAYRAMSK